MSSFGFAFSGIQELITTQLHAKFHLLATILIAVACWYFDVSQREVVTLILCIGMVWTAEAFNTAIEYLVDLVHPEWGDKAGKIKDLAAGAVLLAAITAAIVGSMIFYPYILG